MPTHVLDVGSHRIRIGEGGEAKPRIMAPTPSDLASKGSVRDWEKLSSWLSSSSGLAPQDQYVVALSPWDSDGALSRRKYAEILFEKQGASSIFLSPAAVLSCFGHARQTAVVVDMGATGCVASAVVDGWLSTVESSELGGNALDAWLQSKSSAISALPNTSATITGMDVVEDSPSAIDGTSTSKRMKRTPPPNVQSTNETSLKELPAVYSTDQVREMREKGGPFKLPDGTPVLDDVSRSCVTLLLDPTPLDRPAEFTAVQELALTAATKGTGSELRKTLMGNVIVCGGLARTYEAPDRIARQLGRLSRMDQVRVIVGADEDRPLGAWLGGSIVASLSSFDEFKVTKAEYEAGGYDAVRKKCP